MGKVRSDIKDDNCALAQWLFRKLRNHDPMSVRVKTNAVAPKSNQVVMGLSQFAVQGSTIAIDEFDPTKVYYKLADGRVFQWQVQEVDADTVADKEMVAA